MANGTVSVSSHAPRPPEDADFAVYINFHKGTENPQRIFQAADAMVRAMQKLDKILCGTVDSNIKTLMVLEDIEAGSLKIWLKNVLECVDDDGLKTLDWKPVVGKYLVRAKYVVLRWLNESEEKKSPVSLSKQIQQIAAETDVRKFPDYRPPAVQDLMSIASDVETAKAYLVEGDSLSYISPDKDIVDFDLTIHWSPDQLADLVTKEVVKFPAAPMILAVKKPDYLGSSKWDFRHGRKMISVRIDDQEWLKKFQNREIDVRPGDALRCKVVIENSYGFDNELVNEQYAIIEITEVLLNQYKRQSDFFKDE